VDRIELTTALYWAAHMTGSFLLRSGRTATEYFDKYRFESDPVLLAAVAEHLAPLVPAGTDLLAGLELGGVPVATALALHTGLPVVFVRKRAKAYGTCRLAEGAEIAGRRLLVVEDVVTSGGQIVLSTAELRERGALVTDALCVVDREEGGREALAEIGVNLRGLLTARELRASRSG
jgi:orotate phosphoribosyltransferase